MGVSGASLNSNSGEAGGVYFSDVGMGLGMVSCIGGGCDMN